MTPAFAGASVCLKQLLAANNLEQAMFSMDCKKKTYYDITYYAAAKYVLYL